MSTIKKLALTLTTVALACIISMPTCLAAQTGTVTVDTLRVRKTPSTSAAILRNLDKGDKVEIISEEDEWYKVKLDNGVEAYIYADYVKLEKEGTTDDKTTSTGTKENSKIKVAKDTVIYILPALFSSQVEKTDKEVTLNVIERINNWACVEYNGITGWILEKRVADSTSTDNGDSNTEKSDSEESNKKDEEKVEETPKNEKGYINVSSAFLREKPSKDAEIAQSLYLNDEVTIQETDGDWYKVKIKDKTGYVFKDLVSTSKVTTSRSLTTSRQQVSQETTESEEKTQTKKKTSNEKSINKTVYVNTAKLNVRAEASTSAKIIDTLKLKEKVTAIAQTGNWYKIKIGNKTGYISKDYVVTSLKKITVKETTTAKKTTEIKVKANGTGADIVKYAKKFNGYRYVYGGSGPRAFDCSGFTMYVYKHFGVNLPHNAETQSNYGKYVKKSNLKPGDLVIFNDRSNRSIGHAGVYIGNGKFIHAANSTDGVTIDTLNSGYYSVRFVEGRRLV